MARIDTIKFYSHALKKYGISAKGLCWLNQERQQKRFEVIHRLLPKKLENFVVCDAGCGFGDFYFYLKEHKSLPKEYIGIDIHPKIAKIAQKRTNKKIKILDICYESLPVSDYIIASGSLNILTNFETILFIQNCYTSAKKGFIFNILEEKKDSQIYNYITLKQVRSIAKKLHVSNVSIQKGYLQNDITIAFYREKSSNLR
jgi:SAM-dependent methyltransferase